MAKSKCTEASVFEQAHHGTPEFSGPTDSDLLDMAYEAGLLPESRRSPRRKLTVQVNVLPIDGEGRPVGPWIAAETRNLSATGICICHSEPVDACYLFTEFSNPISDRNQVIVKIIRSVRNSDGYETAGSFVTLPLSPIDPATVDDDTR